MDGRRHLLQGQLGVLEDPDRPMTVGMVFSAG
jgi:hypothetical protein